MLCKCVFKAYTKLIKDSTRWNFSPSQTFFKNKDAILPFYASYSKKKYFCSFLLHGIFYLLKTSVCTTYPASKQKKCYTLSLLAKWTMIFCYNGAFLENFLSKQKFSSPHITPYPYYWKSHDELRPVIMHDKWGANSLKCLWQLLPNPNLPQSL